MKREYANAIWPMIKAFGEGEDVQYNGGGGWQSNEDWAFTSHPEQYRVAPKNPRVIDFTRNVVAIPGEYSDGKYIETTPEVIAALKSAGIEVDE